MRDFESLIKNYHHLHKLIGELELKVTNSGLFHSNTFNADTKESKNIILKLTKKMSKVRSLISNESISKENLLENFYSILNHTDSSNEEELTIRELFLDPIQVPDDLEDTEDPSMFFGNPPSLVQFCLCIGSLYEPLRDILLSVVKYEPNLSLRVIRQFHQPVGIKFCIKEIRLVNETFKKLIDIFNSNESLEIKAEILSLIPEITCPSTYSGMVYEASHLNSFIDLLMDSFQQFTSSCPDPETLNLFIDCIFNLAKTSENISLIHESMIKLIASTQNTINHLDFFVISLKYMLSDNNIGISKILSSLRVRLIIPGTRENSDIVVEQYEKFFDSILIICQFNANIKLEWLKQITDDLRKEFQPDDPFFEDYSKVIMQNFLILLILNSKRKYTHEHLPEIKNTVGLFRRIILSEYFFSQDLTPYLSIIIKTRLLRVYLAYLELVLGTCRKSSVLRSKCLNLLVIVWFNSCQSNKMIESLIISEVKSQTSAQVKTMIEERFLAVNNQPLDTIFDLLITFVASLTKMENSTHKLSLNFKIFPNLNSDIIHSVFKEIESSILQFGSTNSGIHWANICKFFQAFAVLCFCISSCNSKDLQEFLLTELRSLLIEQGIQSKHFMRFIRYFIGLNGVIGILDVFCQPNNIFSEVSCTDKRKGPASSDKESVPDSFPEESNVLASQVAYVDERLMQTSRNSSTNSNKSRISWLSIIGPGAELANDKNEVENVLSDLFTDAESDSEEDFYRRGSTQVKKPPPRLMIQLVGLVEHSTKQILTLGSHYSTYLPADDSKMAASQLQSAWLLMLGNIFKTLSHRKPLTSTQLDMDSEESFNAKCFMKWIVARALRDLHDYFIGDVEESEPVIRATNGNIDMLFALHDKSVCDVQLNLLSVFTEWQQSSFSMSQMSSPKPNPISPFILPELLTLIGQFELKKNNNLSNISALLGCGIVLPKKFKDLKSSQLILLINWFTVLVNIFSESLISTPSHKEKMTRVMTRNLCSRLNSLALLRQLLRKRVITEMKCSQEDFVLLSSVTFNDTLAYSNQNLKNKPSATYLIVGNSLRPKTSLNVTTVKKRTASKKPKKNAKKIKTSNETNILDAVGDINEDNEDESDDDVSIENQTNQTLNQTRSINSKGVKNMITTKLQHLGFASYLFDPCYHEIGLISICLCLNRFTPSNVLINPDHYPLINDYPDSEDILQSLWIEVSHNSSRYEKGENEKSMDWITISLLLLELKAILYHVHCSKSPGLNKEVLSLFSFESVTSLSKSTRNNLLNSCINPIKQILSRITQHTSGQKPFSKTLVQPIATQHDASGLEDPLDTIPEDKNLLNEIFSTGLECLRMLIMQVPVLSSGLSPFLSTHLQDNVKKIVVDERMMKAYENFSSQVGTIGNFGPIKIQYASKKKWVNIIQDLLQKNPFVKPREDSQLAEYSLDAEKLIDSLTWLVSLAFSQGGLQGDRSTQLTSVAVSYNHSQLVLHVYKTLIEVMKKNNKSGSVTRTILESVPNIKQYSLKLLDEEWNTEEVYDNIPGKHYLKKLISNHFLSPGLQSQIVKLCEYDTSRNYSLISQIDNLAAFFQKFIVPFMNKQMKDKFTEDPVDSTLKSLNKSTLILYLKQITDQVLVYAKHLSTVSGTNKLDKKENLDRLNCWNVLATLLVECADQSYSGSENLGIPGIKTSILPQVMRAGRVFLQFVLRSAIPQFSTIFKSQYAEVTRCLRGIQNLTRWLQRISTHAKTHRDMPAVVNQIPQTKKFLEIFVYQVKNMLSSNHCTNAFWLGNLKNKDLAGNEVRDSQSKTGDNSVASSIEIGGFDQGSIVSSAVTRSEEVDNDESNDDQNEENNSSDSY